MIEEESEMRRLRPQKKQKILVTLTAQDSDIVKCADSETMDLNKKDQESSQLCRIMYQRAKKEDRI